MVVPPSCQYACRYPKGTKPHPDQDWKSTRKLFSPLLWHEKQPKPAKFNIGKSLAPIHGNSLLICVPSFQWQWLSGTRLLDRQQYRPNIYRSIYRL
jgi:hypothetical protein